MSENTQQDLIHTQPQPHCVVCGSQGKIVYENLNDRLFGVPGYWSMKTCLNTKCGTHWLDPRPVDEDLGKLYVKYYTHQARNYYEQADGDGSRSIGHRLYRHSVACYLQRKFGAKHSQKLLDWLSSYLIYINPPRRINANSLAMFLPVVPREKVLEVGFGSGDTLKLLATLGWNVEGIDFDPVTVREARAKGLKAGLGSLEDQNFPDDAFRAIVASHVIEHLGKPQEFMEECFRVLKNNGQLVIFTPNVGALGHKVYGRDWRGLEPPRHLNIFSLQSLESLALKAGFVVSRCASSGRGGGIFYESYLTHKKKRFTPQVWPYSELLTWLEWVISVFKRDAGEELCLVAIKRTAGRNYALNGELSE